MKYFLIILFCIPFIAFAQKDVNAVIASINKKFQTLNSYKADLGMLFNVPSINLSNVNGKVIYKKPTKFKIIAKGIFMLPKQNPIQNISQLLADTKSYTAVPSGTEKINGLNCSIVTIVPIKPMGDLAIGKFWIDETKLLIMKSELTTKSNGTIETYNTYGKYSNYGLPDKIVIQLDIQKFKIPKMLAIDIGKRKKNVPASGKGYITLNFSNYTINAVIEDKEFVN